MDIAYTNWRKATDMTRDEFLKSLTDYEKLAVCFGNFNYQVNNGGLMQWEFNDYSEDAEYLIDFLEESDYYKKDTFLELLYNFRSGKEELEDVKKTYSSDSDYIGYKEEEFGEYISHFDRTYYEITDDSWLEYFENYLKENIPDEYIEKLNSIKISQDEIIENNIGI